MSRTRFGQSAADADTLTRARPLATSTESVSCHTVTLIEKESAGLAVEMGDDPSATKWWANRGFRTKTTSGALPRLFPVRKPFFCCLFALPSYGYRKRSLQVGHLRPCTRAFRALYLANCGHHKWRLLQAARGASLARVRPAGGTRAPSRHTAHRARSRAHAARGARPPAAENICGEPIRPVHAQCPGRSRDFRRARKKRRTAIVLAWCSK